MKLKMFLTTAFMILSLSACGGEPEGKSPEEQAKIDAAITAIKDEQRVEDFLYEDLGSFTQWNVGVMHDGDGEYGYASYICEILSEHGLNTTDQVVRIVDVVQVRGGQTPKQASLERIDCETYTKWSE